MKNGKIVCPSRFGEIFANLRLFCLIAPAVWTVDPSRTDPDSTSTEWRSDKANLDIVRRMNAAYDRIPFSEEYEGVLDGAPLKLEWSVGPNLPVPWKGGVAGVVGNQILMAGGMWMPDNQNLAFAYDIQARAYSKLPPPPFETAYTQGACDSNSLYLVGGRAAGRKAARLNRGADGKWEWTLLPLLPESEGKGRWLASVGLVSGKWLLVAEGYPTGTAYEVQRTEALHMRAWRLRLDQPDAQWEPMKPYPGTARALMNSAIVKGEWYLFGGAIPDPALQNLYAGLVNDYGLFIGPYKGMHDRRDSYKYNPDADEWTPIRNLPFGMVQGSGVALQNRYVLLMGTMHWNRRLRMGLASLDSLTKMSMGASGQKGKSGRGNDPFWQGYDDRIICYDIEKNNYYRIGVMLYGVGTPSWVSDGEKLYNFGGEPWHGFNKNTENVLQIGTIRWK